MLGVMCLASSLLLVFLSPGVSGVSRAPEEAPPAQKEMDKSTWFRGTARGTSLKELGEDAKVTIASEILKPGMLVTLKGGRRGLYCSSGSEGTLCDSQGANRAEQFMVRDNGAGRISLCVAPRGGGVCSKAPENLAFEVGDIGSSVVSFKINGKFCSDDNPTISCKADSVGDPEKFTVECIKNCPQGVKRHAPTQVGCSNQNSATAQQNAASEAVTKVDPKVAAAEKAEKEAQLALSKRRELMKTAFEEYELPKEGMVSWFMNEDVAPKWISAVGNYTGEVREGSVKVTELSGHTAEKPLRALEGDTTSKYTFGHTIKKLFSICSISRYTGNAKNSILVGAPVSREVPWNSRGVQRTRGFWTHGHAGKTNDDGGTPMRSVPGYVLYSTPKEEHPRQFTGKDRNTATTKNWVVLCGTGSSSLNMGSHVVYQDGLAAGGPKSHAQKPYHIKFYDQRGDRNLNINYPWTKEASDWAVAEVITWDRALTRQEMQAANKYLMAKKDKGGPPTIELDTWFDIRKVKSALGGIINSRRVVRSVVSQTKIGLRHGGPWTKQSTCEPDGYMSGECPTIIVERTPLTLVEEAGYGTTEKIRSIQGTKGTNCLLKNTWVGKNDTANSANRKGHFTICTMTRYRSTQPGAGGIVVGGAWPHYDMNWVYSNKNPRKIAKNKSSPHLWTHGHWNGQSGVAKYGGVWMTPKKGIATTDWTVTCAANTGGGRVMVNGKKLATPDTEDGVGNAHQLFINRCKHVSSMQCSYDGVNIKSDFALAHLMIWNRALSDKEMAQASSFLMEPLVNGQKVCKESCNAPGICSFPFNGNDKDRKPLWCQTEETTWPQVGLADAEVKSTGSADGNSNAVEEKSRCFSQGALKKNDGVPLFNSCKRCQSTSNGNMDAFGCVKCPKGQYPVHHFLGSSHADKAKNGIVSCEAPPMAGQPLKTVCYPQLKDQGSYALPTTCNSLGVVSNDVQVGDEMWTIECVLWKHVLCTPVWDAVQSKFQQQCATTKHVEFHRATISKSGKPAIINTTELPADLRQAEKVYGICFQATATR